MQGGRPLAFISEALSHKNLGLSKYKEMMSNLQSGASFDRSAFQDSYRSLQSEIFNG